MHHGSCLCGSISYTIEGELSEFGHCHCASCRKASGAGCGANAGVAREQLELVDPQNFLKEFESSPGKIRAFCSNCGSPLLAWLTHSPEFVRIRLGSLDSKFTKRARAHTFVGDKADWDRIHGDIPQFEAWADRDVLVQLGSRQPDD